MICRKKRFGQVADWLWRRLRPIPKYYGHCSTRWRILVLRSAVKKMDRLVGPQHLTDEASWIGWTACTDGVIGVLG
jgi:hypothetical protein